MACYDPHPKLMGLIIKKLCIPDGNHVVIFNELELRKCMYEYYCVMNFLHFKHVYNSGDRWYGGFCGLNIGKDDDFIYSVYLEKGKNNYGKIEQKTLINWHNENI